MEWIVFYNVIGWSYKEQIIIYACNKEMTKQQEGWEPNKLRCHLTAQLNPQHCKHDKLA